MRRAGLCGALAAAICATPAAAAEVEVSMPGRYFDPASVRLLVGDSVLYRNADFQVHDVRGPGGLFDSGRLLTGRTFAHRFEQAGSFRVVCTLHTFMGQTVDVAGALLSAPSTPVLVGEPATLAGRVPAGAASVTIEREAAPGFWEPAAAATPAPDGEFLAVVTPAETQNYRALAGGLASAAVTVQVDSRVAVSARLRRGHHASALRVATTPARPGAVAVLQLYSPERFAWRRAGHADLDGAGRATFSVRAGLRRAARVLVLRRRTGPEIGRSAELALRRGAARPETGVTAPGHDGGAGDHGEH